MVNGTQTQEMTMTTKTTARVTQQRIGDKIVLTDTDTGKELAVLFDGHDHVIVDPYINSAAEVFGVGDVVYDVPAILANADLDVDTIRQIDAMPDYVPNVK